MQEPRLQVRNFFNPLATLHLPSMITKLIQFGTDIKKKKKHFEGRNDLLRDTRRNDLQGPWGR